MNFTRLIYIFAVIFAVSKKLFFCFSYNEIRKKLRGNVSEAVNDLMRNFDAEFGLGHHGGHFPNRPDRGGHFHGSDEEESSCDSSYNQVNTLGPHYYAVFGCT